MSMAALRRSLFITAACRRSLLHRRAHATTSDFLRSNFLHRAPFSQYSSNSQPSSESNTNANTNINTDGDDIAESSSTPGRVISVDRSGLCNPPEHEHKVREESPMVKNIKSLIKFRGGPITVAEYMGEVLTNPIAGFYMNRDVFGGGGDFITSPDVSQMFGELVGVWSMCLWDQMGQPKQMNLVELGPGRGTLMADLLRGAAKFKEFSESLSIHLVECSPALRKLQLDALQCTEGDTQRDNSRDGNAFSALSGAPISWHADLEQVPRGVPTIILAHEFYDALPVHQFQRTPRGWSEKLIDIAGDSSDGFRFVLSREPTTASKLYLAKRLKGLSPDEIAMLEHVEVCPQAVELTENIAKRISSDGGGALIIDYGQNGIISDSLQAIRKHTFVDILDDPGTSDLSAYVDFAYVKQIVEEMAVEAAAFGPISQSQFLGSLGINFRLEALLQNATDKQAEALQLGYWKLVGEGPAPFWEGKDELAPVGMGSRYMALSIVNKKLGAPVCFQ